MARKKKTIEEQVEENTQLVLDDDFFKENGELWYLRELDFFPEKMSEYLKKTKSEEIEKMFGSHTVAIFDNYESAVNACIDARRSIGLDVPNDMIICLYNKFNLKS